MFRLSRQEIARISQSVTSLSGRDRASSQLAISSRSRSQNVILKRGKNVKYLPYAFTEEGVAMLSSVLNSERAVHVNIAIMRAFVRLREILETNRELARKFEELEARVGKHDEQIGSIIEAIRQLMVPPEKPRPEIGFHVREKATRALWRAEEELTHGRRSLTRPGSFGVRCSMFDVRCWAFSAPEYHPSSLKLARCQHSVAATLRGLPSMSLIALDGVNVPLNKMPLAWPGLNPGCDPNMASNCFKISSLSAINFSSFGSGTVSLLLRA